MTMILLRILILRTSSAEYAWRIVVYHEVFCSRRQPDDCIHIYVTGSMTCSYVSVSDSGGFVNGHLVSRIIIPKLVCCHSCALPINFERYTEGDMFRGCHRKGHDTIA
ncbi:hypothetical protein BC834DRAFT_236415 [Gloeopeniophorella convolvens]|nr:hypothetical protein BC834DRAFT_236415 [Gloeopeniophorella convolvens]